MSRYWIQIVLVGVLMVCGAARAQDWPARAITLVVPYPAGGPTDVVGRLFAHQMGKSSVVQSWSKTSPALAV